MGRKRVSASSCATTVKLASKHAHSTDVKPPLKAFKLWCLKKCSRTATFSSSQPRHGSEVVATSAIESPKPAWMREGALDAAIWKALPDEVLEYILGFLPFAHLFRCATVCKQWRVAVQSSRLRLTRAATSARPWSGYSPVRYSLSENGALQWSGFCTDTNKWQEMPPVPLPSSTGKRVVAGAGGLLVIYKPGSIFVCNPVTGQRRELPPTIQKWAWPNVLHMIADHARGEYTIILAGSEAYSASKPQPTEVYESASGRWTVTGSLPADLFLDPQDAALGNGSLYCTAQGADMQAGETLVGTDALVAYDVRRGVWSQVASDLPDESARQTPLVSDGRTIVAVAPVDDDGPVGCFYELHAGSRRWELMASMPESLHRRVRSWGVCVVSGGHVVVVSDTAQGCIVAYDMVHGIWSERRAPIQFGKARKLSGKEVRSSLAPICFRPDVNALP